MGKRPGHLTKKDLERANMYVKDAPHCISLGKCKLKQLHTYAGEDVEQEFSFITSGNAK